MTNYEKYKDIIEKFTDNDVAFDKSKNKIVRCVQIDCDDCAFYVDYDDCKLGAMKWAAEEYKEPEVDWSKVPVDTPIFVSNDGTNWVRRHFAKLTSLGTIWVYSGGGTSWTADTTNPIIGYKYAKLAEVE